MQVYWGPFKRCERIHEFNLDSSVASYLFKYHEISTKYMYRNTVIC